MADFIDADPFDPVVADAVEKATESEAKTSEEAVAAHLRRTKEVYSRVFSGGNATPDDIDFLMRDLAWFCSAHDPLWSSDPREQDRKVARREVFQRIVEYSRLDFDTLVKRYMETQNR